VAAMSPGVAGTSVLNDLVQTLASPQGASYPTQLSEHVLTSAAWALPQVAADAVAWFSAAVEACPWLEAVTREILRVQSACALRRLSAGSGPPANESLSVLVANPSAATNDALAEWITTFVPKPTSVFETLAPQLADGRNPAGALRKALVEASRAWSPADKAALLRSVAEQYRDGELHDSTLRAAGVGEAEPDEAGAVLIATYESCKNNDQRRRVMVLWSLVDPAPDRVRRVLINRIYLPLLKEGKGATRIALDHFPLVRHAASQTAQQQLKAAIRAAADGEGDLAKRAEGLMRDADWITSKRKWLHW